MAGIIVAAHPDVEVAYAIGMPLPYRVGGAG